MQHLIRETKRVKNSIQHALEAAYQRLPDTTLMGAGLIGTPFYTFLSELSCNADHITLFNAFQELFLRSNEVSAIVRSNRGHVYPYITQTGQLP